MRNGEVSSKSSGGGYSVECSRSSNQDRQHVDIDQPALSPHVPHITPGVTTALSPQSPALIGNWDEDSDDADDETDEDEDEDEDEDGNDGRITVYPSTPRKVEATACPDTEESGSSTAQHAADISSSTAHHSAAASLLAAARAHAKIRQSSHATAAGGNHEQMSGATAAQSGDARSTNARSMNARSMNARLAEVSVHGESDGNYRHGGPGRDASDVDSDGGVDRDGGGSDGGDSQDERGAKDEYTDEEDEADEAERFLREGLSGTMILEGGGDAQRTRTSPLPNKGSGQVMVYSHHKASQGMTVSIRPWRTSCSPSCRSLQRVNLLLPLSATGGA
jgi:hypothetical protein